jgi:hypothetical protein
MLDNNPPEQLSAETLNSVSVVLTGIQEAAKKDTSSNKLKTFPFEIKMPNIPGLPINKAILKTAEKSKAEILQYLKAQGAVEEVIREPLSSDGLTRPDFLVTIKPDNFSGFYDKTLLLTVTRAEVTYSLDKTAQPAAKDVKVAVQVRFIDNEVMLWVDKVGSISLKKLRSYGPQANFLDYLIAHPNQTLGLFIIQTEVKGCKDKNDLTELVRNCGFNKTLKHLFFPKSSQKRLVFQPTALIDLELAQDLKNQNIKS